MKKSVLSLLILFTLVITADAQSSKIPTIEQSLNLKSAAGSRISPDGRLVAYQVQETNWEENAFESEIWIAVVATGDANGVIVLTGIVFGSSPPACPSST